MKKLFLILTLLLFVLPAEAAITFVQAKWSSAGSSTSITVTLSSAVGSGDLLFVWAQVFNTSNTISVSDSLANTWTCDTQQTGTSSTALMCYVKSSASGASDIITISQTGAAATIVGTAAEYSGTDTAAPLDVVGYSFQGANATQTTPSVTTANANDVVIAAENDGNMGNSTSPAAPFTLRTTPTSGTNAALADNIVTATGSYSATFTNQFAGAEHAKVTAAFKQAGGGAAPPPPQLLNLGVGALAYAINQQNLSGFRGCLSTDTACTMEAELCDEKNNCLHFPVGSHSLVVNFAKNGVPTPVAYSIFQVTSQP
ncbi:MAG: hypothetical protein LAN84_15625 [Acidobacteriia bacterium]|nr:hypothetical protein [Terriglobia bacterium]